MHGVEWTHTHRANLENLYILWEATTFLRALEFYNQVLLDLQYALKWKTLHSSTINKLLRSQTCTEICAYMKKSLQDQVQLRIGVKVQL